MRGGQNRRCVGAVARGRLLGDIGVDIFVCPGAGQGACRGVALRTLVFRRR